MGSADAGHVAPPLVSVIIPVYNREPLVRRALASVFSQTYTNFEIIVVDDASTDGLPTALAEFADPRLRCIAHPHNRGAAAARNTGIAAARGEFVAFLDSDDMWFGEKLAHQVAAMRDQPPSVAGHVCAYECVKAGYGARCVVPNWTIRSFQHTQLFGCTCGPGTTLLCRRQVFSVVGLFDESLRRLEDWEWILRLANNGYRLLGSARPLAHVDVGANVSRQDIDAALERIWTRHSSAAEALGSRAGRIFKGSIYLERAAAAYGDRDYRNAARAFLSGLCCYPLRGGGFYWRMVQRVTALARQSFREAEMRPANGVALADRMAGGGRR